MKEDVLAFLTTMGRILPELRDCLFDTLAPFHFPKGAVMLAERDVCGRIFFLTSGMAVGVKWQRGKEVTSWIMREGDTVTSPESFFSQTPSKERIVAVEDCRGWGITWRELQDIYERFPAFNLHGRIITENYYVRNLKLTDFMKCYRGKEKYKILLENDPELIRRCPQKYLASYLGVNPTTLSAIRSKMNKRR